MRQRFASLLQCKRGASTTEYALLLGLIVTVLIGGLSALGEAINEPYQNFAQAVP